MTNKYIARNLIANRGHRGERTISETEIPSINGPIIILGDPGSGKTELTKTLEKHFGFVRVSGGAFHRNQDLSRLSSLTGTTLIVDGLDEITSSSSVSAIDEVLKKLSQLGNPSFILSCRSADWQGSTDRHKISEDYGLQPVTLHLEPFTYEDAKTFLNSYDGNIDGDSVLNELVEHDLSEFYVNPLTLTLVAEIVAAGQGLPKGQVELLDRATELLTSERNPAHQRSAIAQLSLGDLLDSAGAAFSHLLLSGSTGLTDRPREQTPDGYVSIAKLNNASDIQNISTIIKTRLFQSPAENLYIPFHRVIAEYLGARWLSKRIAEGVSERRVFQALTFNGGVPTAFRGMHAWLAHFSPRLASRCIKSDPYGVLRYGEPDRLPLDQARLLLNSLASLAKEDPYFRNEDWGKRAISGLARPELKDEVIALIKNPERHVHLSTLILESLGKSPLTNAISEELLAIVENPSSAYVERSHSAEALIDNDVIIDWPEVTSGLQARRESGDKRLALEIIALTHGTSFPNKQIAEAIVDYRKPSRNTSQDGDSDHEPYVLGMVYGIAKRISPRRAQGILDEIASYIKQLKKTSPNWHAGYELRSGIHQLLEKVIADDQLPSPEQVWSWLKLTEGETGYSSQRTEPVYDWLMQNIGLRREIQRIAFSDATRDDGSWMAIVHDLPTANRALSLSMSDAVDLLIEIGSRVTLGNLDIDLWSALIQSQRLASGISEEIREAAEIGMQRHVVLERQWNDITSPPKRDWQKEERERKADRDQKRARRFAKHRASFWPIRQRIASGEAIEALKQIANAYLGRYNDLDREAEPAQRVRDWLGNELATDALVGFVSALTRTDMPTPQQIAETHAENKEWNFESVLVSGISELIRSGRDLNDISRLALLSSLASWWEFSDFNSNRLGEHIQEQLEATVFRSDEETESFLRAVVEPRIRAGHQYVPALYRLAREPQFKGVAGKLALQWLRAYPGADSSVQLELLQIAIEHAQLNDLQALVRERVSEISTFGGAIRRMWMSAAFLLDFERYKERLRNFFGSDRDHLWCLKEVLQPDRHERRVHRVKSVPQLEFIILTFADKWPPVPHPSSSWGTNHPWDATEFINSCIDAIGANPSEEATISLERIISCPAAEAYSDRINHTRALQRRLRRDTEFRIPTFDEVKQTLSNGLPGSIDDLKAMIMDRLELVQDYLRNGDTNAWEAFWANDKPKKENTCRDRLLDQLRPRLPSEINFLPEITMPEANRADLVAIYREYGLPIEIKGQWHPEIWNAASVQLIEKYARDWRADDRGIYLALWFGHVPRKNLPKHPRGLPRPTSPDQFCDMLTDKLTAAERTRIDIYVLDVSRPKH
jgi:hypothetical protein